MKIPEKIREYTKKPRNSGFYQKKISSVDLHPFNPQISRFHVNVVGTCYRVSHTSIFVRSAL